MNQILQPNTFPISIGGNKVINNIENIPNRSMFIRIPTDSFVYETLADNKFYLTKIGANYLSFRNSEACSGDPGCPFPEFKIDWKDNKGGQIDTSLGVYRQICSNGAMGWDNWKRHSFPKIMQNKISKSAFNDIICESKDYINNTIKRYLNIDIEPLTKIELLHNYTERMKKDSSLLKHWSNNHRLSNKQIKLLFNDLNNDSTMLKSNRKEDNGNNGWLVFNTIQENMTKTLQPIMYERELKHENKILTNTFEEMFG